MQRINNCDAVGWMDADVDDRKKKKIVLASMLWIYKPGHKAGAKVVVQSTGSLIVAEVATLAKKSPFLDR